MEERMTVVMRLPKSIVAALDGLGAEEGTSRTEQAIRIYRKALRLPSPQYTPYHRNWTEPRRGGKA